LRNLRKRDQVEEEEQREEEEESIIHSSPSEKSRSPKGVQVKTEYIDPCQHSINESSSSFSITPGAITNQVSNEL
jgi:hypothetical protein